MKKGFEIIFKLIKRLILTAIIAGFGLSALSLWQGGKPFRWLGEKSEQAGDTIKKNCEEISRKADKIKKKTEDVNNTTKKVADLIRKTGDKIKDNISGLKAEK